MLYNKYRPKKFEQIVGNESTVNQIQSAVEKGNFPHAVIFSGEAGCGKTTTARIVARALGCARSDYVEINAADVRGIDGIRQLIEMARVIPKNKAKVFVLDEAHQLTTDAQNALLKLLEEPPKDTYFILSTTDPEKLLPTIRSRCTDYRFAPLNYEEAESLVTRVLRAEGKPSLEQVVIQAMYEVTGGRPRELLTVLEKLFGLENPTEADVYATAGGQDVITLCRQLAKGEPWKKIAGTLKKLDSDPEMTRRVVSGYFSSILLNEENANAYLILDAFRGWFRSKADLVRACYEAVVIANMEDEE